MVFLALDHLGNIKALEDHLSGLSVVTRSNVDLDLANKPTHACWLSNCKLVAIGRMSGKIELWSISEMLTLKAVAMISEPVVALGCYDDHLVAIGALNNFYVLDPLKATSSCIKCHISSIECTCNDVEKTIYMLIIRKISHKKSISLASFSKISSLIALVSDFKIFLFEAQNFTAKWISKAKKSTLLKLGRSNKINCICFLDSINQAVIAVGYGDGSIAIYDTRIQRRPVYEFVIADTRSRGESKHKINKKYSEFDLSSRFPQFNLPDRDSPLRPIVTINLIYDLSQIIEIGDTNYNDSCEIIVTDSTGNISKISIITGDLLLKKLGSNGVLDDKNVWNALIKSRRLSKTAKTNDAPAAHAREGPQFSAQILLNYQSHHGAIVSLAMSGEKFCTASLDQTCGLYNISAGKMEHQIHLLEKQSIVLYCDTNS